MSRPVERPEDVFSTDNSYTSGAELCARIPTCKSCMVFMERFDGVHAFGYNSAASEAILTKSGEL